MRFSLAFNATIFYALAYFPTLTDPLLHDTAKFPGRRASPDVQLLVPYLFSPHPTEPGKIQICSGVLLNEDTMLTAAHCVMNPETFRPYEVEVVLGSETLREIETPETRPIYPSKEKEERMKIPHENMYFPFLLGFMKWEDLAILKLPRPFKRASSFPKLPEPERTSYFGESLTACGWGKSNINSTMSLHVYCTPGYYAWWIILQDENEIITAGGWSSKCVGDSGGPLFDSANVLIGIQSRAEEDCNGRNYVVRLSSYVRWIKYVLEMDAQQ